MDPLEQLLADAEALDREAAAADWLAGLAEQAGDDAQAAKVAGEADVLRSYAALNRAIVEQAAMGEG
jgi:hypothetical protein